MKTSVKLQIWKDEVSIQKIWERDYLCLSDMAAHTGKEDSVKNWMKNKDTVEFLGWWEKLNNDNFDQSWFLELRSQAGTSRFLLSPQKRKEHTNAIWIVSKAWKWWWTYAHIDIALKFATHLSPMLDLYITKDYQRLKKIEQEKIDTNWDQKRALTKINFSFMTDAIQQNLIPDNISGKQIWLIFAEEMDLVNLALFNMTAAEWKQKFPNEAKKWNMRDYATPEQLVVLTNLEFKNSELIKDKIIPEKRLEILNQSAIEQMTKLTKNNNSVKKVLPWANKKYLN
jgi:hypothetical protein